jgi:hypothetical protein
MAHSHPSSSSACRPPTMTTTTRLCCTRTQYHHHGAVAHHACIHHTFIHNHPAHSHTPFKQPHASRIHRENKSNPPPSFSVSLALTGNGSQPSIKLQYNTQEHTQVEPSLPVYLSLQPSSLSQPVDPNRQQSNPPPSLPISPTLLTLHSLYQ